MSFKNFNRQLKRLWQPANTAFQVTVDRQNKILEGAKHEWSPHLPEFDQSGYSSNSI
ncbi:MAG: hypothetical protein M1490_06045 [Candidatus Bathyarchaeota archaeon]|nr:hypothetical protein [Candidatus Bathyarchaeota archaeon]